MTETQLTDLPVSATARSIIDCDIHNVVPSTQALFPYLSDHWRESVNQTLFRGAVDASYPKNAPVTARPGSLPPNGDPAGSDLSMLQSQVLDPLGIEIGILACTYAIDSLRNPDAAIAMASAVNDWQIAEWLNKDSRLRASIVIPSQIPEAAAAEIDRVGDHPGFVQALLPARSHLPWGNRIHHPIFAAIERHNLVAGIHFGGSPGNPPTPAGWPSYYFEEYSGMATVFQSQVVSIVSEGTLDAFPNLRIACLESGFTWIPAFMWRFDKEWRNLRRLVPWVRKAPSEYMRERIRFTIQPMDAPPNMKQLMDVIDQIGSDEMLLFATDYPHLHTSAPESSVIPDLPPDLARKILSENARAFYRL